ncbi:MAG: thioredoxin family protein [Methylibium sp.]|nr:thioredoxin family protein [Methylibium sp.]
MQHPPPEDDAHDDDWLVACLCADWCGSCREYRATFEQVARKRPQWRFAWVDIEDEADALAPFELDIESFPTVLIAKGNEVRFLGAMLPHAATLERALDAAQRAGLQASVPAQAQPLVARLRAIGRSVG